MSTKALRTQLIAAVAMVLVAAIALGSSTYAWFVTNAKVTAQGMKVQATAEAGLVIMEKTAGTIWNTVATGLHDTGTELLPTSTADAADWYHSSALYATASDYDSTTMAQLTIGSETSGVGKVDAGDAYGYYIVDQFKIKPSTSGSSASDLKMSGITVTGTTDALSPALRVLVKGADESVILAPVTGATLSYNVGDGRIATTAVASDTTTVLAASFSEAAPTEVSIYVYFEGEDEELYTNNIPSTLQALSISVDFTATIG